MKINRLLEITILLMNKGTVTAKELAERFQVSTRTIYRDIDVLSTAGVPVYTNKGNGGGISLLENYSFSRTLISDHESESLLLALKTLQATKYPEIDLILDKIGSVFKNAVAEDWVYIDFSPWSSKPNEHNKFLNIKKAILERKVLTFEYINAQGTKRRRNIEPMRLIFKGQSWYLWGYCRDRGDFRTFRISRIKNLSLTGEGFIRRKHDSAGKEESVEYPQTWANLKLKFHREVLHRVYDDFDEELVIPNDDDTWSLSVSFPEDEWVYGYILSFGHYVEVEEPEYMKRIILERMKKAMEYYEK
ncbi:MAG: YafY family transcriptional regulator [Clostridia bacterium]|nr:YafY family transcriptional regulator [Clostridia bacterium]